MKLPQMSNKPIELDLPGRLFLIGKGSLKAGSQRAVKIEVWSYMDRGGKNIITQPPPPSLKKYF